MKGFICVILVLFNISLIGNVDSIYLILLLFIELIVFSFLSISTDLKQK